MTDESTGTVFPFDRSARARQRPIEVTRLGFNGTGALIRALVPDDGDLQICRDLPRQATRSQGERRKKLIVVLEGILRLTSEDRIIDLLPGMVAELPADVACRSVALGGGATYLVARAGARVSTRR